MRAVIQRVNKAHVSGFVAEMFFHAPSSGWTHNKSNKLWPLCVGWYLRDGYKGGYGMDVT